MNESSQTYILKEAGNGKTVIRYFISYAHKDTKLKTQLLEPLEQYLNTSKNYYFEAWDDEVIITGEDWHEKIQAAVAGCHFGLLLVSPNFLGSEYIENHELPAFVPINIAVPDTGKRVIPLALTPILFDGIMDLKGLEKLQIFHLKTDKNLKTFQDARTKSTRDKFALELFQQIIKTVNNLPCLTSQSINDRELDQNIDQKPERASMVSTLRISNIVDERSLHEILITGPHKQKICLPYRLDDSETKSKLINLRKALRKLIKIGKNEGLQVEFNQLNKALSELNCAGNELLSILFNGQDSEVVKTFRRCCPKWNHDSNSPSLIVMSGESNDILPIEFLPLFNNTEWLPVANYDELRLALCRFPGFSSVVYRKLSDANVSEDLILDNDPVLPLKYFHHQELHVAKSNWEFFKDHDQFLELEGPWPGEYLDASVFRGNLAKHLQNPFLRFNGEMQSRPDQIQHFVCHCQVCEPADSNESKLCFSSTLQASIGDLQKHFVYNRVEYKSKSSKPIIFLNACGSTDNDSFAPNPFPKFFLNTNNNRGYIGTEERIPDRFASEFSKIFYQSLLRGDPLGEAIYYAKWELLKRHRNPLGLLYTMYANPDIRLLIKP